MFAHTFDIAECDLDWKTVIANITSQEECDTVTTMLNDTEAQGYHLFKVMVSVPADRASEIFMGIFIFARDRRKVSRKPFALYSFEYSERYDKALEVGATLVHQHRAGRETAAHILRRG